MKTITTYIVFLFTIQIASGQTVNDSLSYRVYNCYSSTDSIQISSDFTGPRYLNYHEGAFIYFWTNDSCVLAILCGGVAELTLDESYKLIKESDNTSYYSEKVNRYAKRVLINKRYYQYQNATLTRKEELDFILEQMKNKTVPNNK